MFELFNTYPINVVDQTVSSTLHLRYWKPVAVNIVTKSDRLLSNLLGILLTSDSRFAAGSQHVSALSSLPIISCVKTCLGKTLTALIKLQMIEATGIVKKHFRTRAAAARGDCRNSV